MKTLELSQMEILQGGQSSVGSCAGAVLGIGGAIATVFLIPATGGLSILAWGSMIGGGLATGFSVGDCIYGLANG